MANSKEANRFRREIDKELIQAGLNSGRDLVWSAGEVQLIGMIMAAINRKCELQALYAETEKETTAETEKETTKVKLSAEIRLLEAAIRVSIREIKTDVPEPKSLKSIKAAAAANARWSKEA